MGLVATMREMKETTSEQLNRLSPNRSVMVDGSLSELVSHALNFAYTKRNFTTGEPYYGAQNPTGNPPPGAGNIPNIHKPDAPIEKTVRPSLEGMQQMQEVESSQIAAALVGAIDATSDEALSHLSQEPVIIYAIPPDGNVPEEMNEQIDMYHNSGAIDCRDFVFVYTDSAIGNNNNEQQMVDLNQKVKDYEGKGARVYADLQSFLRNFSTAR